MLRHANSQYSERPISRSTIEREFKSGPAFTADGSIMDGTIIAVKEVFNDFNDLLSGSDTQKVLVRLCVTLSSLDRDPDGRVDYLEVEPLYIKVRYEIFRDSGKVVPNCYCGYYPATIDVEAPFAATKTLVGNMKDDFAIEVNPENIKALFTSGVGFILADDDEDGKAAFNDVANFILADFIKSGYTTAENNLRMYCTSLAASEVR